MNRDQNTFFSDLLQNLGFIAAGIVAISQFTLSKSFLFLFNGNENLLKVSSIVALVLSMSIFLGFFTIRFNLLNKIYLNKKNKDEYIKSIPQTLPIPENETGKGDRIINQNKQLPEPFNFNLVQLGFVFLILALIAFVFTLCPQQLFLISLFYVLFICFTVASISIFSIQLYRDKEGQKKRNEINNIILNKIRDSFVGEIKTLYDSTELFQFNGPNRHIIIEYQGKKYDIFTKSYDPENYFLLSEKKD